MYSILKTVYFLEVIIESEITSSKIWQGSPEFMHSFNPLCIECVHCYQCSLPSGFLLIDCKDFTHNESLFFVSVPINEIKYQPVVYAL